MSQILVSKLILLMSELINGILGKNKMGMSVNMLQELAKEIYQKFIALNKRETMVILKKMIMPKPRTRKEKKV